MKVTSGMEEKVVQKFSDSFCTCTQSERCYYHCITSNGKWSLDVLADSQRYGHIHME